jgi:hypothetical protein
VPEPIRWRIERQPHPRPAHHRKPLSAFRRLRPFVPCPIPCSHSGCERRRSLLWYAQRLSSERTVSALNRRTGQRTSGNMPEAKRPSEVGDLRFDGHRSRFRFGFGALRFRPCSFAANPGHSVPRFCKDRSTPAIFDRRDSQMARSARMHRYTRSLC